MFVGVAEAVYGLVFFVFSCTSYSYGHGTCGENAAAGTVLAVAGAVVMGTGLVVHFWGRRPSRDRADSHRALRVSFLRLRQLEGLGQRCKRRNHSGSFIDPFDCPPSMVLAPFESGLNGPSLYGDQMDQRALDRHARCRRGGVVRIYCEEYTRTRVASPLEKA